MILEIVHNTVLDLLDEQGIMLDDNGWTPSVASQLDDGSLSQSIETMQVTVYGDFEQKILQLEAMSSAAKKYVETDERSTPVYLRAQLSGMTTVRRAVITAISYKWTAPQDDPACIGHPALTLAIKHTPWEDEQPVIVEFDGIGTN